MLAYVRLSKIRTFKRPRRPAVWTVSCAAYMYPKVVCTRTVSDLIIFWEQASSSASRGPATHPIHGTRQLTHDMVRHARRAQHTKDAMGCMTVDGLIRSSACASQGEGPEMRGRLIGPGLIRCLGLVYLPPGADTARWGATLIRELSLTRQKPRQIASAQASQGMSRRHAGRQHARLKVVKCKRLQTPKHHEPMNMGYTSQRPEPHKARASTCESVLLRLDISMSRECQRRVRHCWLKRYG